MAKIDNIIEEIGDLSVLELVELVEELEEKFGVSAAAPVAVAGVGTASESAEEEKKDAYNVVVTEVGDSKINVIKVLRKLKPDLGLKEAKEQVESLPMTVEESLPTEEAKERQKALEEAGATVSLE